MEKKERRKSLKRKDISVGEDGEEEREGSDWLVKVGVSCHFLVVEEI